MGGVRVIAGQAPASLLTAGQLLPPHRSCRDRRNEAPLRPGASQPPLPPPLPTHCSPPMPCHFHRRRRDFFLRPENYADCQSLLVRRFGELVRKVWNPRAFKGQVSPHEFMQASAL